MPTNPTIYRGLSPCQPHHISLTPLPQENRRLLRSTFHAAHKDQRHSQKTPVKNPSSPVLITIITRLKIITLLTDQKSEERPLRIFSSHWSCVGGLRGASPDPHPDPIPVTRVSYIRRGGWVDLASMHGGQRPISPQVLTKLSRPPPVHSRTAAMHLPWFD